MRWLLPAICALFWTACGFDPDPYREMVRAENVYSYEFSDGVCSTGKRVFLEKSRYCLALADETLNAHCAARQRIQLLTEQC